MNAVHLVGKITSPGLRGNGRFFFTLVVPRPSRGRQGFDYIECVAQGKVVESLPNPLPLPLDVWVAGRLRKESGSLMVAVHDFVSITP